MQKDCRVLELFAGLGGFAAANPSTEIVAAIDIDRRAKDTYLRNFSHAYHIREIESLEDRELIDFMANFWWLSPPCQPYSRRGKQLDVDDPRSRALLRLLRAIPVCKPETIVLENVPGFAQSQAHTQFQDVLNQQGYCTQTVQLCPSQMGWPNRRPRFYLIASLVPLAPWNTLPQHGVSLEHMLEPPGSDAINDLWLPESVVEKYESAFDRIDGESSHVTACFGSSYGKSLLHSGSYLRQGARYRYFSPREVARLLGFPDSFALEHLPHRTAWKLLGNSLSLPAVRYILTHL
jgi:site-specific DNA-cytosine methylase